MAAKAISPILLSCHICGASYERRQGQNKYCGEPCRRENERLYRLRKRSERGLRIAGQTFRCERCGIETVLKWGHARYCADCKKIRRGETYKAHRERHPERVASTQKTTDERRKDCPRRKALARIYQKRVDAKRTADPKKNLDHRMGQLIRFGLGKKKAGRKWETLVDYTVDALAEHLERQFLPGMTWANMGKWHIDHILPRAMFDYQSSDDDAFKACWAITNLRPLWSGENVRKGGKRLFLI